MITYKLWDSVSLCKEYEPVLEFYPAVDKKTDATAVIFPGGGYRGRSVHEGEPYAKYLNSLGMSAFVCEYRVAPDVFPAQLLDARRAIRFVRANAQRFGIASDKIAVMGSSAGGHLAALVSTYECAVDGEGVDVVDEENCKPNATILCYPVIHMPDETKIAHEGSYYSLLGDLDGDFAAVSPDLLVSDTTPTAFIWHTSEDAAVNVINSYRYAEALRAHGIAHEMHIFPFGRHGLGLASENKHAAQWVGLLKNWLCEIGWLDERD